MRPYVPTPRTDAEAIRFTEQFPTLPIYGVGLNFSRALERALCAVVAADRAAMYERCPDCEEPTACSREHGCKVCPLSPVGEIAQAALGSPPPSQDS